MTYLLLTLLALAIGWAWGHATARIHIVPLCTSCKADESAILQHERARFDEVVAGLDLPDDHGSSTA
ncbi:MAG: hypothetical protein HOV82_16775 [Streptomyces sp.]|nr:hypothetical protein [Streptomyces sp.]NUP36171.1 hypothetical protein [Streptomyces sp.]NUS75518.1 hypothetical protein [Streptomyces sp.]